MPSPAIQPDLIISLSQDRVRLNLTENFESGRTAWQTVFNVDSIFLEEQISHALDKVLIDNPFLINQFSSVEIIVLDRPNICLSRRYLGTGHLGEIASRYLRLRVGDTLATDPAEKDAVICYSLPTETLLMLKEYYTNISCKHFSSIVWHALSSHHLRPEKEVTRLYFVMMEDTLVLLGEKNNKLIFSKNFSIKDQADLFYYSIACSRMLKAKENWLVTIGDEIVKFEMPGDSILKIDHHLTLSSLHVLMAEFNICES